MATKEWNQQNRPGQQTRPGEGQGQQNRPGQPDERYGKEQSRPGQGQNPSRRG